MYEGEYLLGTSIARPLIAKRLVEIAKKTGADAISHGATGKGNDQVRFELGAYALMPDVRIIAPWREWDLTSREKLLAYAEEHGIPVEGTQKKGGAPYSMDANLLHISYEGGMLEDPNYEPEESMWRITVSPEEAPRPPGIRRAHLRARRHRRGERQVDVAGGGADRAEPLGGKHGVGRLDLVENRYVGMKSRGCYETPGGTIMLKAHRAIESITLDREVAGAEGRPHAALRAADLQRLLVQPRAARAAGADRPHAAERQRHGARQALQGDRDGHRPELRRRIRCSTRRSRRSTTTRAPTTRPTPRASSG